MESDWLRASLAFVADLYPTKAQGEVSALYAGMVAALRRHARAAGVVLLQLEDPFTVRRLAVAPEQFGGAALDAHRLAGIIAGQPIQREDEHPGPTGQVALPIVQDAFQGALLLWCPMESARTPAFLEFLERARQEVHEVIRLGQLAGVLAEWRTRSNAILETLPQGVVFVDHSGERAWVNSPGAALLEIPAAAQEPPVIAAAMQRLRTTAVNAQEIAQTGSRLFSAPDQCIQDWKWVFGEPVSRVLSVSSMPLASSGVSGRLWVFDDVTLLHRAAEELRALNSELAEKRREADERSRAKSEFLANMSHEIRTPLNAVLGLAQVLQHASRDEQQRGMATRIQEAGQSLLVILNDILDYSKIEAGHLRIEQRPLDLGVVLARLDSLMGQAAQAKGLALRIEAPEAPLGPLLGDPLRLEQVLLNLIGNAIKFTEQGGVTVQVEPCPTHGPRLCVRFTVQDTGIGIAPAAQAQLFAPFTQAEEGITRRFGGTGLGLSISKRLVELMGGEIGVESRVGEGTRFWMELPFAQTARVAAPPPPSAALPTALGGAPLVGLHLLVVDDNRINLEVVERMLALKGARATLCADGQQAVQHLKALPGGFDAVLMDVRMPVMDGLTATRLIRGELGLTGLPIIALTAGVMPEERRRADAAGVNEVLAKPLDLNQLVAALVRWVRPTAPAAGPTLETGSGAPSAATMVPIPGIAPERLALLTQGDAGVVRRLLRGFVADVSGVARQVGADLAQGARTRATDRLHGLRGAAANLGALELARRARALEDAIQADRPAVGPLLAQFTECLAALMDAAAPWLAESGRAAAPAASLPAPLDADKLTELRMALATHKPRPARHLFAELEASLVPVYGAGAIRTLRAALDALRFAEALSVLDHRE